MKSKNKVKLIAYITASSMLLSGFKMNFNTFFNKENQDTTTEDFTTSMVNDESEEEIPKEIIIKRIPLAPKLELNIIKPNEDIETRINPIVTSPDEIMVRATTAVNLRSSNTADSIKIGELKINDTAYKILTCDNNWDLIKTNNQIGYVYRDYLEYTDKIYELNFKHTVKSDIVITTAKLNFREWPNVYAKKISTFDKNTELEVLAEVDNGWLLVRNNGVIGYVYGGYVVSLLELAKLEYPELNLEKLNVQKIVYSTVSSLNIRRGNNTEYEKIGNLEKYESTRVLGEYDNWYFIMTNEYKFGFISKNFTEDLTDIYVVVDISKQTLYLYNENKLYYVTPVTTGKDSTPSDVGLFNIYAKILDKILTDNKTYWSPVKYWMPYNGGEGLHDANWRFTFDEINEDETKIFGTQLYNQYGSHGCINIPPQITDEIYETVSIGTKVLVHK